MRRITIIGNLTADAEVKDVSNKKVINFSIGTNEKFKDQQGNVTEKPYYYNCSIWRDSNVNVAKYLTKGTKVFIEGSPDVDSYQDKEGNWKAAIKISVSNLELIGGGKDANSNSSNNNSGFNNASNDELEQAFGK
jgi:single-strand DNA-binding protein